MGRSIFYSYHPYVTYANSDNNTFLKRDSEPTFEGWPTAAQSPDVPALFDFGKDVFSRWGDGAVLDSGGVEITIDTPEKFDEYINEHYVLELSEIRNHLVSRMRRGGVNFTYEKSGDKVSVEDIKEGSNPWFVGAMWDFFNYMGSEKSVLAPMFRDLFLLAALERLGNILVSICLDGSGEYSDNAEMHRCYYAALEIETEYRLEGKFRSDMARQGAAAKLANDPKQEAKRFVYECWRDWQDGKREYASQAKFARDMLDKKGDVLDSQPSIENWCRQWKKGKGIPLIEPAQ